MARRPRYFRRPPTRRSKPTILIATEGKETEPIYFEEMKARHRDVVTVLVSPGRMGQSNPLRVLGRLRSAIAKQASWQSRDQAWLVVDTDRWTEAEKRKIEQEIEGDSRIHLASSNPCFELWLLLHFRHAWDSVTSADLERALNSPDCFGSYTKENYDAQSLMERVKDAIDRARQADHSLPDKWTAPGETHVYRVVEKIREIHS